MKKTTKNSSKRKWIVGGVVAFAAVALLTTGFATWVVGVNETSDDGEITVNVDTAENQSIEFEITLSDSTITLAETAETNQASGSEIISSTATNGDLTVTCTYEISYGGDSGFNYTQINFSFDESYDGYKVLPENEKLTADMVADEDWEQRATDGEATYFELETSSITLGDPETEGNISTITGSETISFTWGDFFGNNSPVTYYNSLSYSNPTAAADAITEELNAMGETVGSSFTLIAELA